VHWIRIESPAYWIVFVGAFLTVASWESRQPNRPLIVPPARRWGTHGVVLFISSAIGTAIMRLSPVVAAVAVSGSSWGLLSRDWLPVWIRAVIAFLLLDLVKYASHRLLHHVPWFWRIHQVHHSDPDFDVSTAARVHPLEFLVMQGSTLAMIALLAPPPAAVLAAELCGVVFSFFEHANASLPQWLEARLRPWVVTPDVHRIHHSERMEEQFKNLGEIFPWWDRMFGSYQPEPAHGKLVVGMAGQQHLGSLRLGWMLGKPFQPTRDQ
jgi:sterol desaturase/sphingolipid hydroxylase (fatty acid hydroxylase superfamily)